MIANHGFRIRRLSDSHTQLPTIAPSLFAEYHAQLGEKDQAFEWLETAYDQRDGQLSFLNVMPLWDPLRDDPRFHDLLRRMNLEP